ncbi:uncharacterized protein LOC111642579 [Centruroides sculpturatus]|uniref:uncharacterized protein LOC111642579 n=1 Tax=Centruroides sculpturatus TaxID=218467 RepID=UPI000C6E8DCC|nr:uncharacterized protein LOC111642579 [Centruroides sculpturatus]
MRAMPPMLNKDGAMPFYKNLTVLLPVVISVIVLLIVIITVIVCLRRQTDDSSRGSSGDGQGRKERNSDQMGLTEFSQKGLKDNDPYGKTWYYSSPKRKLGVESSLHRNGSEENHEYAEPYATVPTPRSLIEDSDCRSVLSLMGKSDGHYATVKRSPPRIVSNFSLVTSGDARISRQVPCTDRQDNSGSSQSAGSEGRPSSLSSEGYRPFRQGSISIFQ